MEKLNEWVKIFIGIGLSHAEAHELVDIIIEQTSAGGASTDQMMQSVRDVITAFQPQNKIGDWLDIFRED